MRNVNVENQQMHSGTIVADAWVDVKMQKLSALVFSRDNGQNNETGKGHCRRMRPGSLMYSGEGIRFRRLKRLTRHIEKGVDLYRTIALGYADPIRAHGLSKCKHNWVLYIDTDEREMRN